MNPYRKFTLNTLLGLKLFQVTCKIRKSFLFRKFKCNYLLTLGMGEMTFKITKMTQKLKNREPKQKPVNLPEAHTCFNQLVLPGK